MTQNKFEVTVEELVDELSKQVASLNLELTAHKIAVKKLQEYINTVNAEKEKASKKTVDKNSETNGDDF